MSVAAQNECLWYLVWSVGAGPTSIQARSPGQAVEHFLAIRGMLSYSTMFVATVESPEFLTDVEQYVNHDRAKLDQEHTWIDGTHLLKLEQRTCPSE